MTTRQDPRLPKYLDALHFSFEMLGYAYSSLYPSCLKIAADPQSLYAALAHAWTFIDTLHRLREVSQAIPGLGQRQPQLRIFLDKSAPAETYRHYIQHLRSELAKRDSAQFPVWGSLSWQDAVNPKTCHIAIMGVLMEGTGFPGGVWDQVESKWVSTVSLSIQGTSFHFDRIKLAVDQYRDFVIPWLENQVTSPSSQRGLLSVVSATINDEA